MARRHLDFADLRRLLGIAAALQVERGGFTARLESLLAGVSGIIGATVAQAHQVTYLTRSRQQAHPLTEVISSTRSGKMQRGRLAGINASALELEVLDRPDRVITGFGAPSWMDAGGLADHRPAEKRVLCSTQFIGSTMTAVAIVFLRPHGAHGFGARELQIVDTVWRSFRVADRSTATATMPRWVPAAR